ncbi:MAG: IscS subfamily cysteine desulfurase [Bryobacterales bacterium]|nr:IscS subfamily cysteine desulfurase [Bryobacteraceae bacterium]MDW8356173.1 IscS subfamily cysteine desulfurase [Bryobacterales bacterium]
MGKEVYFDNHATTPVDPRVVEAMLPYFTEKFGNAASKSHRFGWEAERAVETARRQVAALIGAEAREIVFTSGATESNNLALKGVAERYAGQGDHLITALTEHKAVLDPCRALERRGYRVTYLPVDREGLLDPDDVRKAITPRTILISVMYANNEIGVVQPIAEIGRIAREHGVLFHTDATQAVGKIPVDVNRDAVDLLSLSAHKMYGPKGVGALYVRHRDRQVELAAQMDGGGHERGVRSGTLNVPGIVGLGEACAICQQEMPQEAERLRRLRDRLKTLLESGLEEVYVNGSMERRLPNNLNMSFLYVEADALLVALKDIALSTGSACTSAIPEPSHVLRALHLPEGRAQSAVRFGLGRFNTEEEVDYVAARVIEAVTKLRELSPLYELARGGSPNASGPS